MAGELPARMQGASIRVTGVVQGVGFRPFVFSLARRFGLSGWVRNTSAGVEIEIDGAPESLKGFEAALRGEAPPLARLDSIRVERRGADGYTGFRILESQSVAGAFQPVSPDVGICGDCLRETFDPSDRRYRYPFTNCTNCGPRYTIITDIPYDRPNTTMAGFALCPACAAEYEDPLDRRFHAQPVACPTCGPHVWLEVEGQEVQEGEAGLQEARALLRRGGILAIKGLGGFHLACDATAPAAVSRLRERKRRVDKAFAVMVTDLAEAERHGVLEDSARRLLQSVERPIVIVGRRPGSSVAEAVAPGQRTLGLMLPYTPLHHLLMEPGEGVPRALVMTSGNLSEEPIATENDEARSRLAALADGFLLHDRPIRTRCDDSVMRVVDGEILPLRRSRGYAPFPVHLAWDSPPLLAGGAELKNAFCLARGRYAFLSHHIGDLENFETLQSFEDGVHHMQHLFRIEPQAFAYDLHPDYLATRYVLQRAEAEGRPAIGVQHHHAHIAAGMAEHGLEPGTRVIGVAFDGTGYGDDGAIWGGEFLIAGYEAYRRAAHLAYIPLPGGDRAVRQPWRLALAWLLRAGLDWEDHLPPVGAAGEAERRLVRQILESDGVPGLGAAPTSSMGRLFDAAASLIGVRHEVNYEAQAAVELEAIVAPEESRAYRFDLGETEVDPRPVVESIVRDLRAGVAQGVMAARFHNGVARMVADVCDRLRRDAGVPVVVLSGGVWQNATLVRQTTANLRTLGFEVLIHRQVPPNDGGLALGQAAVAAARLRSPAV
jgi:hydrogenase maturation protein HypF